MTALDVYELTMQGGATDFARLIRACESFGPYCLIVDMAVNCYVEPIYSIHNRRKISRFPGPKRGGGGARNARQGRVP